MSTVVFEDSISNEIVFFRCPFNNKFWAVISSTIKLPSTSKVTAGAMFPIAVAGDQPDFGSWIEQAIRLAQDKRQT